MSLGPHGPEPAHPGLRAYLGDALNIAEEDLRRHMSLPIGIDHGSAIARTNALAALLNAAAARCQLEARRDETAELGPPRALEGP